MGKLVLIIAAVPEEEVSQVNLSAGAHSISQQLTTEELLAVPCPLDWEQVRMGWDILRAKHKS